jgi:hypothetical protein
MRRRRREAETSEQIAVALGAYGVPVGPELVWESLTGRRVR